MSLTREQIMAANDLPSEEVDIPEWGGSVYVRTMTGMERDTFEQEFSRDRNNGMMPNVRARFLAPILVDDKGRRLFSEEEVAQLGGKSARVLDRLFEIGQRLNGLSADDVEELAGN